MVVIALPHSFLSFDFPYFCEFVTSGCFSARGIGTPKTSGIGQQPLYMTRSDEYTGMCPHFLTFRL